MYMKNELFVRDELAALASEYDIVEEIGRGGLSVVYLARERELGRDVAIKVIRNNYLEDPEALERLNREARMLAQLHHPNIVTILSAKRLPDGTLALVMQLARGNTLRKALDHDGAFPCERAVSTLRQIGSALSYIHGRGIVHRDVKPENLFLEEEGRVLLSDLGIAKGSDSGNSVTLAGVVIGTPAYMSPEQIDGGDLDGRSDLYSLALVGYEMLSGTRPWAGENLYSIILKQKTQALPPLTSIRDDIPPGVVHALERAMAKDPEERWASVDEFLRHLDGVNGGALPVEIAPVVGLIQIAPVAAEPEPVAPAAVVPAPLPAPEQPAASETVIPVATLPIAVPLEARRVDEPAQPLARSGSPRGWQIAAALAVIAAGGAVASGVVPGLSLSGSGETVAASPAEVAGPASTEGIQVAAAPAFAAPVLDGSTASPSEPTAIPAADGTTPAPVAGGTQPVARPPAPRPTADAAAQAARVAAEVRQLESAAARTAAPRATASSSAAPPVAVQGPPTLIVAPARETAPRLRNQGAIGAFVREQYATIPGQTRIGGTAVLDLTVDAGGRVVGSRVAVSSGHPELDNIAIRVAAQMRFAPGERNGVAVQSRVQVPLVIDPREE
jgi:TonB family protein